MILASAPLSEWLLPGLAAVAYGVAAALGTRMSPTLVRVTLLLAWLLHGAVIVAGLVSKTPHFGFAQACSITVWLMMTVYLVESRLLPQLKSYFMMAGFGTLGYSLALQFVASELR